EIVPEPGENDGFDDAELLLPGEKDGLLLGAVEECEPPGEKDGLLLLEDDLPGEKDGLLLGAVAGRDDEPGEKEGRDDEEKEGREELEKDGRLDEPLLNEEDRPEEKEGDDPPRPAAALLMPKQSTETTASETIRLSMIDQSFHGPASVVSVDWGDGIQFILPLAAADKKKNELNS